VKSRIQQPPTPSDSEEQTRQNRLELEPPQTASDSGTSTRRMLTELELQAEGGDGAAACKLGDHFREGVSQDLKKAYCWYGRGAELGDAGAQNNLGTWFLNGLAGDRDPVQAVYWYRKSAEQGQPEAQYNLGRRYLLGDGATQDYAEARNWFEKAAVPASTYNSELSTKARNTRRLKPSYRPPLRQSNSSTSHVSLNYAGPDANPPPKRFEGSMEDLLVLYKASAGRMTKEQFKERPGPNAATARMDICGQKKRWQSIKTSAV
jgi:Sel1 repeat-containing protein